MSAALMALAAVRSSTTAAKTAAVRKDIRAIHRGTQMSLALVTDPFARTPMGTVVRVRVLGRRPLVLLPDRSLMLQPLCHLDC